MIQPIKFACDALPDCQGQIVESLGNFVIIEGMAQDSGAWFAKGVGGARRFGTRQEAADYIEYAQPKIGMDSKEDELKALEAEVKELESKGRGGSMGASSLYKKINRLKQEIKDGAM